jgi:DNA ligase-1
MKAFAALFAQLDSTTSILEKVAALKNYFSTQDAADSMWTVLLLTGRLSRRVITARDLRLLFQQATQYPEWLLEECLAQVGDTAETLSLLAQSLELTRQEGAQEDGVALSEWMENRIYALAELPSIEQQIELLLAWWRDLDQQEVFLLNKLITGAFRVGVSEKLVIRALAELHEIPSDQIAHRMTGVKKPGPQAFAALISKETSAPSLNQPYPFCLAHAWSERKDHGFEPEHWCVEWKFDGIRAQIISRQGQIWIWSRGEDEITASFPDLVEAFKNLPSGTVLDGEIVVLVDGEVRSFNELQARLGRKKVSAMVLKERPAGFLAYDCMEHNGHDIRALSLRERKAILTAVIKPLLGPRVQLSKSLPIATREQLEDWRDHARENHAEGVMIKSWSSPYAVEA